MKAVKLYTLLKVKSRKGLGAVEWLWLKLSKKPPADIYASTLSDLRCGKSIEEEPWETDGQGREVIPSLPDKRFFLTSSGRRRLRKLKRSYLWERLGKAAWYLLWLIRKLWVLIIGAVAVKLADLLFPALLQGIGNALGL